VKPDNSLTYLVELQRNKSENCASAPLRSRATSIVNTSQFPETIKEEEEPLEHYIRRNLPSFRKSLTPQDIHQFERTRLIDMGDSKGRILVQPGTVENAQQPHVENNKRPLNNDKDKFINKKRDITTPASINNTNKIRISRDTSNISKKENFIHNDPVVMMATPHPPHAHKPFISGNNESSNRRPSSRVRVMLMVDSDTDNERKGKRHDKKYKRPEEKDKRNKHEGQDKYIQSPRNEKGREKITFENDPGEEESIWPAQMKSQDKSNHHDGHPEKRKDKKNKGYYSKDKANGANTGTLGDKNKEPHHVHYEDTQLQGKGSSTKRMKNNGNLYQAGKNGPNDDEDSVSSNSTEESSYSSDIKLTDLIKQGSRPYKFGGQEKADASKKTDKKPDGALASSGKNSPFYEKGYDSNKTSPTLKQKQRNDEESMSVSEDQEKSSKTKDRKWQKKTSKDDLLDKYSDKKIKSTRQKDLNTTKPQHKFETPEKKVERRNKKDIPNYDNDKWMNPSNTKVRNDYQDRKVFEKPGVYDNGQTKPSAREGISDNKGKSKDGNKYNKKRPYYKRYAPADSDKQNKKYPNYAPTKSNNEAYKQRDYSPNQQANEVGQRDYSRAPKSDKKKDKTNRVQAKKPEQKSRDTAENKIKESDKNPKYFAVKTPKSATTMTMRKRYHIQIPKHGQPETWFSARFNINDEKNVEMNYEGPVKITNYYSSNKYS